MWKPLTSLRGMSLFIADDQYYPQPFWLSVILPTRSKFITSSSPYSSQIASLFTRFPSLLGGFPPYAANILVPLIRATAFTPLIPLNVTLKTIHLMSRPYSSQPSPGLSICSCPRIHHNIFTSSFLLLSLRMTLEVIHRKWFTLAYKYGALPPEIFFSSIISCNPTLRCLSSTTQMSFDF